MSIPAWLQHPYAIIFSRWILTAIFLTSALGKLRDRRDFVATVLEYQVLPKRWARRYAMVLPWLEAIVGLMLLVGLGTRVAAGLSGLLLSSFILAAGLNLLRGRKDLNCGCSGARHHQHIGGKVLLRNGILLSLSLALLLWGRDYALFADWPERGLAFLLSHVLLVGGGLPFAIVVTGSLMLYLLIQQLIRFVQTESGS